MGRIVLLLVIVLVLWLIFRGFSRSWTKKKADVPAKSVSGEDMVVCSVCHVNLPRSEARLEAGTYYCNDNPKCRHVP